MASEELKCCPFCGCSMSVRSNRDWHRIIGDHDEQCVFMEAETMMVSASDEQLAIAVTDWNRRAQDFDAMRQRAEKAEQHIYTDNAETLRNALARIELLEGLLTRALNETAESVQNSWPAGLSVSLQADIDAYLAQQAKP